MKDSFLRSIDYLRISVTDRCNMRCLYCMPREGISIKPSQEILTYEEILLIVKASLLLGINKIRITGGEPMVRKDILGFLERLSALPGIEDLAMTTNGLLLFENAEHLMAAGLKRLNISLDTLKEDRFFHLTGVHGLNQVWKGVKRALDLGFSPIKLNVVILKGFNEDEVQDFTHLIFRYPLEVRFIEWMPLGGRDEEKDYYVPNERIKEEIGKENILIPVKGKGNGPAKLFTFSKALGQIGFISPLSCLFCHTCNRLRLTSEGSIRPCLAQDMEFDLKSLIRGGASLEEVKEELVRIIQKKPQGHNFYSTRVHKSMMRIGG